MFLYEEEYKKKIEKQKPQIFQKKSIDFDG